MGNPITAQFVGDDFPGLGSTTAYQSAEKPLGSPRNPSTLQKNIDDIPILVDRPPQIMLFAPDLEEDLVDIERVAESPMLATQPLGKSRPELDAPKANRLVADGDTPLGQQIFDIPMAQIESMIQPDRIADDVGWKTVTLVQIHATSIGYDQLTCHYPLERIDFCLIFMPFGHDDEPEIPHTLLVIGCRRNCASASNQHPVSCPSET